MPRKTVSKVKTMEDLLKSSRPIRVFKPGEILEGTVISISHKEVLVDVGAKSEGIISGGELADEFETYKTLKPGDKILAAVVQPEDTRGYLVLSLRRAEAERRWRELERLFKEKTEFEVKVLEYNKGGILVDALGLRGFVPISHLNKEHFSAFNKAVSEKGLANTSQNLPLVIGETLKVKIIELEREKNRLVLSEKEVEDEKTKKQIKKKLEKLKIGEKVRGTIVAVLPFGYLVDINGVDGLVHISEIAWEKVSNPADLHKVGDKVDVKILSINKEEGKLALSMKALKDNPWEKIGEKYPEGSITKGKVSKVLPFGAFVELEPGIEGLIHVSETAGPLEVGQEVKAMVMNVDAKAQKLALSIRKIEESKIYK